MKAIATHTRVNLALVCLAVIAGLTFFFDIPVKITFAFVLAITVAYILGMLSVLMGEEKPVDPWAIQRAVMEASGQQLAPHPSIHNGTLLYTALIMEETSETYRGVYQAMSRALNGPGFRPSSRGRAAATQVLYDLGDAAGNMEIISRRIRGALKEFDLYAALNHAEAKEIFDGGLDTAVVAAGLLEGSGFPSADGYAEVGDSNLSKRNPDTGRIDKTPDGKWIKGRNYREADLLGVLKLSHPTWYAKMAKEVSRNA